MKITEDDAKRAGRIAPQFSYTDEELAILIKTTTIALAFLGTRGPEWGLATTPLRHELYKLEGFASSRGWPKNKIKQKETNTVIEFRRILDEIAARHGEYTRLIIWEDGSGKIMEDDTELAGFDDLPELMKLLGL